MRPAFSSIRAAAAFAALLLLLLLLPALVGKSWLPPREQIYSSLAWGAGAFPYLHDQIFNEKGDIDLAFMGSSRIWWGIDTPMVQKELSARLGREAVVRTFGWDTPGFDPFYFILQDLLRHRKVHILVFSDTSIGSANTAHDMAPYWFRLADNSEGLSGLAFRSKITFYTSAILGMPRNFLGLLRANRPAIPSDEISWSGFSHLRNPTLQLGALTLRITAGQTFENFTPHTDATPADVRVYSEATRQNFKFEGQTIPAMQAAFARKVGALARENHVKLVYLRLPDTEEATSPLIVERTYWPDLLHADVAMMGIPTTKLFAGLSQADTLKLFYNHEHFNQNGQEYFTSLITPTLVQIYEDQTKP